MRIIYLIFLVLWPVLPAKVSMSNPNQICFLPEPGDTNSFGSSVVVNDKYLAIGDPRANKVIIYTPNDSGKWNRTREILPPVDLNLDEDSSIFGNNLELDGDVLTISARTKNPEAQIAHLPRKARLLARYSYWRYLINLNTKTEVKPIDLLIKKEPGLVKFNLLRRGKIEQIVLPDNEEERFGSDIALHQNLLLVGSPSYLEAGGGWLFDLERLEAEPLKIVPKNIDFATISFGETVAVSKEFAAIGHRGRVWYDPVRPYPYKGNSHPFTKTLIQNLNNGLTKVLDSYGELSLSGNVLVVMRPSSPDGEQTPLLEVFRLDEDATPQLIIRRTDVSNAWVQNGFLILVKHSWDFPFSQVFISQVCIEPLH